MHLESKNKLRKADEILNLGLARLNFSTKLVIWLFILNHKIVVCWLRCPSIWIFHPRQEIAFIILDFLKVYEKFESYFLFVKIDLHQQTRQSFCKDCFGNCLQHAIKALRVRRCLIVTFIWPSWDFLFLRLWILMRKGSYHEDIQEWWVTGETFSGIWKSFD